ncbi:MAG: glycosyltransferase family 4 protein [Patescibacteria group bacterium]|jgi:hypothetical protein
MKVNFLVPTTGITGGIRVIFEHANRLAARGYEINIIYPYVLGREAGTKEKIIGRLKKIRRAIFALADLNKIKWFDLNPKIKVIRVPDLSEKYIPEADATIATANETADWLALCSAQKGEKYYFIQDYETWTRDKEKVDATWRLPLKKIVISGWLKKIGEEKFKERIYGVVPNGVNIEDFDNPKKKFNKNKKVLLMYHLLEKKGFKDGLEAFSKAQKKHPEISLVLFGAYPLKEKELLGFKYYFQPSRERLRELYSTSDIFLWPSRAEGYGLPPMEAMASKCAVISTDTGAVREYAIPGESVILVPALRPGLMASELIGLIEDEEKLKKIALNGYDKIKEFGWERASKILESIINPFFSGGQEPLLDGGGKRKGADRK